MSATPPGGRRADRSTPRAENPDQEQRPRRSKAFLIGVVLVPVLIAAVLAGWLWATNGDDGDHGNESATTSSSGTESSEAPEPSEQPEQELPEVARSANEVLVAWSDRGVGYDEWWTRLEPLLTPGGREAYAFTDPEKLPDLGEITYRDLQRHRGGTTATVWFKTNAGRFGVDMSQQASGETWLANKVVFPGGRSMFG